MSNQSYIVGFPPESFCNVLQLYLNDQPCLVFGRNRRDPHDLLLANFLGERGILYQTVEDELTGRSIPAPAGEDYRLVGAGRAFPFQGKIIINGDSGVYGIEIDREHLNLVVQSGLIPFGWELHY